MKLNFVRNAVENLLLDTFYLIGFLLFSYKTANFCEETEVGLPYKFLTTKQNADYTE